MPPRNKSMAKRKKQSTSAVNVDDQLTTSQLQPVQTDPIIDNNDDDDEPFEDEPVDDETVTELNSAQEETTTVQADDIKILGDDNNSLVVEDDDDEEVEEIAETVSAQESNVSKSPCKNDDVLAVEDVGNGDIKGAQTVPVNENETPLAVEDESRENVDDDNEQNDDIAVDNVDNKGEEDASLVDNKIAENPEIYVGKLDKDTVEDDLVKAFQPFGELESTRIVRNNTTKKSKGFAFVRFASVDQTTRALSELKDGVEVRGKLVKISKSQTNKTLFLGNISKTWSKEEVLQQLAQYGIEHIQTIRVPEDVTNVKKMQAGDTKSKKKIKGFAFLEFSTHSEAAAAFQRLKKPDVVFGRDVSVKVSFEESKPPTDENVPQVNRVHVAGLAKDWNEEKVKEICEKYGQVVKIDLHQSSKPKHKDFGFITFSSPKSALACVEGINTAAIVGETEIIAASLARPIKIAQKQGLHGGAKNEVSKLDKEGEVSNKASESKSKKMKGVLNSQQTNINGKDSSKNKIKAGIVKSQRKGLVKKQNSGEAVKGEKQSQPLKKVGESSKSKNKRKASSEKNSIAPPDLKQGGQGNSKKPKRAGESQQNSKTNPKAGNNKRKKAPAYEGREDRDSRNAHGKSPLKKHKGSMHGRERDNYRNPQGDARVIRRHDDYRTPTRYVDPYAPTYAASTPATYHLGSDSVSTRYAASTPATYHLGSDSVSTRRRQEMEPHAGYIQPAAKQSQSYSGYIQSAVGTTLRQHQPVYLEPASTSQSYSRYLDHPVLTQSHRRYIETPVVSEVQPYRGYRQSEIVQIAHDPYDPGLTRVVRQDNRGSGVLSYVGGPSLPASHVPNPTSYYPSGSTYSGAYGIRRPYY